MARITDGSSESGRKRRREANVTSSASGRASRAKHDARRKARSDKFIKEHSSNRNISRVVNGKLVKVKDIEKAAAAEALKREQKKKARLSKKKVAPKKTKTPPYPRAVSAQLVTDKQFYKRYK